MASLPSNSIKNVDPQRGAGTFDKSIAALKQLNAVGYGQQDSDLSLSLVCNPQGTSLPPYQLRLQADYIFAVGNLARLMCMNTISLDWQGNLFDCALLADFQLG